MPGVMHIKVIKWVKNIEYGLLKPNVNFILLLKISALNFIFFTLMARFGVISLQKDLEE
jgi:hypothetical protein